jgi:hypothetical protein
MSGISAGAQKGAYRLIERVRLHSIAQDTTPRGWMRQGCALKGEQVA